MTLEHGERFGKLTVLRKVGRGDDRGAKYACGCACGFKPFFAKPSHLMSGRVKSCRRCRDGGATLVTSHG
jgi:hypothetical protein